MVSAAVAVMEGKGGTLKAKGERIKVGPDTGIAADRGGRRRRTEAVAAVNADGGGGRGPGPEERAGTKTAAGEVVRRG